MDGKSGIIRVSKRDGGYVLLARTALDDPNLTLAAKGLHAYLLSKYDNWKCRVKDIQNHCGNGRDAVYAAMRNLIEHGYMRRRAVRDERGVVRAWEHVVYEVPPQQESPPERPLPESPEVVRRHRQRRPLPEKPEAEEPDAGSQELLTSNKRTKESAVASGPAAALTAVGMDKKWVADWHNKRPLAYIEAMIACMQAEGRSTGWLRVAVERGDYILKSPIGRTNGRGTGRVPPRPQYADEIAGQRLVDAADDATVDDWFDRAVTYWTQQKRPDAVDALCIHPPRQNPVLWRWVARHQ
jgi:hypothetical protein